MVGSFLVRSGCSFNQVSITSFTHGLDVGFRARLGVHGAVGGHREALVGVDHGRHRTATRIKLTNLTNYSKVRIRTLLRTCAGECTSAP